MPSPLRLRLRLPQCLHHAFILPRSNFVRIRRNGHSRDLSPPLVQICASIFLLMVTVLLRNLITKWKEWLYQCLLLVRKVLVESSHFYPHPFWVKLNLKTKQKSPTLSCGLCLLGYFLAHLPWFLPVLSLSRYPPAGHSVGTAGLKYCTFVWLPNHVSQTKKKVDIWFNKYTWGQESKTCKHRMLQKARTIWTLCVTLSLPCQGPQNGKKCEATTRRCAFY